MPISLHYLIIKQNYTKLTIRQIILVLIITKT